MNKSNTTKDYDDLAIVGIATGCSQDNNQGVIISSKLIEEILYHVKM